MSYQTETYPSVAFEVGVEDLKSPSTPKSARSRLEASKSTPLRRPSLVEIEQRIDSASKKKQEIDDERSERAGLHIAKAHAIAQSKREQEVSSREELQQQLNDAITAADEKKSQLIEEKAVRAGLQVTRAKEIAHYKKQEERFSLRKIQQSLDDALASAAEKKNQKLSEKKLRAGRSNEHVKDVMLTVRESERVNARQRVENIEDSLAAAEEKKAEFLQEKSAKAGSVYYRAKEIASCMREIEKIETRRLSRDLDNDLRAAEAYREDIERQKVDKLHDQMQHVEKVRQRRRSTLSLDDSSQEIYPAQTYAAEPNASSNLGEQRQANAFAGTAGGL